LANPLTIALGKLIQVAARLRGGGGSAFPGLVVEKIEPDFAVRVLERLKRGVVVISGTNGKTTTTKIVTELLQSQGLKVFTNATGSNFMRGVIASLLSQITLLGRLDADIAVLELDEAHAARFVQKIAPRYSLLLNVMRDQLDRFGEIDHTADLLAIIARHTTEVVVVNREDNRLARFAEREELLAGGARLVWYGLAPGLTTRFPQDDELYADEFDVGGLEPSRGLLDNDRFLGESSSTEDRRLGRPSSTDAVRPDALVTLEAVDGNSATYGIGGAILQTELELKGIYNVYNAAAALALVRVILDEAVLDEQLVERLATIRSAFGRGETFSLNGRELELLLVKNPGGFRLALESFESRGFDTMIAINDEYADGRDMSWLFDVGFSTLGENGVAMVSGTRAWDMVLRLRYDEVPFKEVDTELVRALDRFIQDSRRPMRVYCTYTAMLRCRNHLGSYTVVSKVK
jgi:UDP-N-acetylmuramyl tripeptide synthase